METRPAYRSATEILVDNMFGKDGEKAKWVGAILGASSTVALGGILGVIGGAAVGGPLGGFLGGVSGATASGVTGALGGGLVGEILFRKSRTGEAVDAETQEVFTTKRSLNEKIGNFFFGLDNTNRAAYVGAALGLTPIAGVLGPLGEVFGGLAIGGALTGYLLHKKQHVEQLPILN